MLSPPRPQALGRGGHGRQRFHDVQPTFTVFNIDYANTIMSTGQSIFFYSTNGWRACVRVRVDARAIGFRFQTDRGHSTLGT